MRVAPPYSEFEPAPEFGARVAYFPLSFLGAELEGMIAPAETSSKPVPSQGPNFVRKRISTLPGRGARSIAPALPGVQQARG